jgi:hypothetical protein
LRNSSLSIAVSATLVRRFYVSRGEIQLPRVRGGFLIFRLRLGARD